MEEEEAKKELEHHLLLKFMLFFSFVVVTLVLVFGTAMNLLYFAMGRETEMLSIVISVLTLVVGMPLLGVFARVLSVSHKSWKDLDERD